METEIRSKVETIVLVVGIVLFIIFLGVTYYMPEIEKYHLEYTKQCANNGYEIYVDGIKLEEKI